MATPNDVSCFLILSGALLAGSKRLTAVGRHGVQLRNASRIGKTEDNTKKVCQFISESHAFEIFEIPELSSSPSHFIVFFALPDFEFSLASRSPRPELL